jgi:hypothetical protein
VCCFLKHCSCISTFPGLRAYTEGVPGPASAYSMLRPGTDVVCTCSSLHRFSACQAGCWLSSPQQWDWWQRWESGAGMRGGKGGAGGKVVRVTQGGEGSCLLPGFPHPRQQPELCEPSKQCICILSAGLLTVLGWVFHWMRGTFESWVEALSTLYLTPVCNCGRKSIHVRYL